MNKNNSNEKKDSFLNLFNFIYGTDDEIASQPIDEIRKELEEEGLVTKSIIDEIVFNVKKKQAQLNLKKSGELRSVLLEKMRGLKDKIETAIQQLPQNKEELMQKAADVFGTNTQVAFRGYENINEDDLKSLIEDLKRLGVWEDIEKENG